MKRGAKTQYQRDYRIPTEKTILESINAGCNLDPNQTVVVVSVNGRLFELNLTASIIYEELINGRDIPTVIAEIVSLFEIEYEKAENSVDECVKNLVVNGILEY